MSLSLYSRLRLFRARHRDAARSIVEAWRYLVLGTGRRDPKTVDVLHPNPTPSLCTCYGQHNAGREAYDDHNDGCPWLAARCDGCAGAGYCRICGGDGIHPLAATDGIS